MVGTLRFAHPTVLCSVASRPSLPLRRQVPLDRRQEEYRDIDREPDAPENRAQRRAVAEIGEDIGDPHDQEENSELVDQVLWRSAEFRQQDGGRKERKRLDAVLVGAERAGTDGVLVEGGI